MRLHLFPVSLLLLLFIVPVPRVVCQDDQHFVDCSRQYECGSMNIVYPFWGGDRPEVCGYPGFELTCSDAALLFTMEGARYRVLDINNSSNTVTISRADYWDTNCPAQKANTTLNSTLFSYNTSYPNVTIYYECSVLWPIPNQFNCSGDTYSYYVTGSSNVASSTDPSTGSCKENVRVPISQSAASNMASGGYTVALLTAALQGGFGLEWNARNEECKGCVDSGGQCGSESNQFACYCGNGTSASTCETATTAPPPGMRITSTHPFNFTHHFV